jgi:hypothetical protein
LLATVAVARVEGVDADLIAEWGISQTDLLHRANRVAEGSAPKAWRFAGEMDEIAATFREAGLPPGFHDAAAEVFRRLSVFKDAAPPSLDDVIESLVAPFDIEVDDQTKSSVITPRSA